MIKNQKKERLCTMANKKKKGGKLWPILTVVFAILTVVSIVGTNIALSASQAINIFLKIDTYKIVDNGGDDEDTEYFKLDYDSVEELEAAGQAVSEQLHAEGSVLLMNNGALPLDTSEKISTLSHSSVDVVTCGTGSADIDTSTAPTLKEALESRGFSVNPTLWDFYKTGAGSEFVRAPGKGTTMSDRNAWHINEVPASAYTAEVKSSFAEYGDVAVVTLSRISGECVDLEYGEYLDGTNVLDLTPEEQDMLKMANENFDKVIVLLNSTNAMECEFLTDPAYGVDAC